ncbi:hypothetical protein OIU74_009358 [Salix koriyanagi]|uniref:Uncharacterized protein n=1 Tax=Salix koriyanagi TaxID=2511006 RepID=A0A9Q0Z0P8_9ROSI|nr:hypothetical protein OIU74_009358 [Salix koriyanagi]
MQNWFISFLTETTVNDLLCLRDTSNVSICCFSLGYPHLILLFLNITQFSTQILYYVYVTLQMQNPKRCQKDSIYFDSSLFIKERLSQLSYDKDSPACLQTSLD